MKITIGPKMLLGALKCAEKFASDDDSRPSVNQVFFRTHDDGTCYIVATDGVSLVEFSVKGELNERPSEGTLNLETLERLIVNVQLDAKNKIESGAYELPNNGAGGFPQYLAVFPENKFEDKSDGASIFGVDAELLEKVTMVQKEIKRIAGKGTCVYARVQTPNTPTSPIMFKFTTEDASTRVTVLIMPTKL